MHYILTGFTHDVGFRVFSYEGTNENRTRTRYTVRVELAMIPKYGIHMQELPLLCQGVLERRIEGEQRIAFTYSEDEMRAHASDRLLREATAQSRKKPPRRPVTAPGAHWRGPSQIRDPQSVGQA